MDHVLPIALLDPDLALPLQAPYRPPAAGLGDGEGAPYLGLGRGPSPPPQVLQYQGVGVPRGGRGAAAAEARPEEERRRDGRGRRGGPVWIERPAAGSTGGRRQLVVHRPVARREVQHERAAAHRDLLREGARVYEGGVPGQLQLRGVARGEGRVPGGRALAHYAGGEVAHEDRAGGGRLQAQRPAADLEGHRGPVGVGRGEPLGDPYERYVDRARGGHLRRDGHAGVAGGVEDYRGLGRLCAQGRQGHQRDRQRRERAAQRGHRLAVRILTLTAGCGIPGRRSLGRDSNPRPPPYQGGALAS